MAYVDNLVDTQDAVMHDFNDEDLDDGGKGRAKDLVKPTWQIRQDLLPSSKVTSTWSWTTSTSSTATLNTP
jgi:hypothetical protein